MKKIIFLVIILVLGIFLIGCTQPDENTPTNIDCGDGICAPREEALGTCPADCEEDTPTQTFEECMANCVESGKKAPECKPQCEDNSNGTITPPIINPPTTTSGLNLVKEIELGVGETRRPLVAVTDDRVFVIYGERQENSWDFILKIYDKTLENELVSKTIIDGSELELGMPMDIRIGVQGDYLYLFHDAVSTEGHYLLGYKFTLDDAFEKVASPSTPLSSSVFWEDAKTGDELIDDPIVLPTQDKLFVITRYFGNIDKSADTIYKVYELTHDLEKVREFDLDLSSVSDGGARQANIREYNGNYYMSTSTLSTSEISGSRAAVDTLSPTDVLIVKLDTSWNILDSHIIVGEIEDDAESYLTAFGLDEKYYYFSYKHATFDGGTSFETPLKVYDKSYNIVTDITFAGSGRPQLVLADGLIYYALGIQTGGPQSSGIVVPSKLYVYELTE